MRLPSRIGRGRQTRQEDTARADRWRLVFPVLFLVLGGAWVVVEHTILRESRSQPPLAEEIGADLLVVVFVALVLWFLVTRVARSGAALLRSEERFRALIEHSQDVLCRFRNDPEFAVDYLSPAAAELTGYQPSEFYADPDLVGRVLDDDGVARIRAAIAEPHGSQEPFVLRWRCRDGSVVVTECRAVPIFDAAGRAVAVEAIARDVTARLEGEAERARLVASVEQTHDMIIMTDLAGWIVYVNPAFERASGHDRSQLIGQPPEVTARSLGISTTAPEVWETLLAGEPWTGVLVNMRPGGGLVETEVVVSLVRDEHGTATGTVWVGRDETRERALEAELRQAQKMEAVGNLAGGIAHDFNNLLTAIRGYSELLQNSLSLDDPRRSDAGQVVLAADRAAELVHQLLAFSRRQVLQPKVIDVAVVVAGITPMLRRLLGEHIELVTHGVRGVGFVEIDPGQLEQVIVNLAVNARDAMPGGGRLTITTANVELDDAYATAHAGRAPGPFVELMVADTGAGMDDIVRSHVFEPFFTTKEAGKGTGMGLATVYGIVKQSNGSVDLWSEPGRGTTFRFHFPRVGEATLGTIGSAELVPDDAGSETILLVEDDDAVRAFARRALSDRGYTVLEAADGAQGLLRATRHAGPIDLLVTDVIMPYMNGRELVERLAAWRPGIRVLYISGFAEDVFESARAGESFTPSPVAFLAKPFHADSLCRAVRRTLDDEA